MPASCRPSSTRSSQPNSYEPSAGSSSAHEKTPTVTIVTPASRISRRSSSQIASGHCSGL